MQDRVNQTVITAVNTDIFAEFAAEQAESGSYED